VYLAACRAHGMELPHDLDATTLATPWPARYAWSCWNSVRAMFSLAVVPGRWDGVILIPLATLLLASGARFARDAAARGRLAATTPWIAWGAAWFLAASVVLAEVFPSWAPYRAILAGIGFGVAITATIAAAHPALAAGLVALRLFSFAVSAGPPPTVTVAASETGAANDFAHLVRLQRLVRDTREVLLARFPTLPHGARVGMLRRPLMTGYAYRGSLALQLWYRDTTLRLVRFDEFRSHPEWDLAAIVEFQQEGSPQVLLVSPVSMRHYLMAGRLIQQEAWQAAYDELTLAESLQSERGASAYLGRLAGRRALCWLGLGRWADAEREARRGLALWPEGSDARYTLASVMASTGRRPQAQAELDTLLRLSPDDRSALALGDSLRIWAARGP
jgi:tetratricopeptide (TPR) repeat protein